MDYVTGSNNYIDFAISGQNIFARPGHDVIDATIRIEADGNLIFTETKNLHKAILYWFFPSVNIYNFNKVKISILDKNLIVLDYYLFENIKFDFELNTIENKFKVIHFGKKKVNIQLINVDTGVVFCDFFADFGLGENFWHVPNFNILDFNKFKFSIYDESFSLLIDRIWTVNKFNYVFCHIPKNAGTSIYKFLANNVSHNIVDKNLTDSYICAFVRNPYDRFLSCYYYLKSGGKGYHSDINDSITYIGDSEINDFIQNKLEFASTRQTHFRPQSYWIPNGADFIGRYENLQEDFDKLTNIIGLPSQILPVTNKSKRGDYDLTPEDKEIIYQIYKEDFERFGYSK